MSFTYCDFEVLDDDFVLDTGGNPTYIYDRDVIAQDMKHKILESGILTGLIGERGDAAKSVAVNRLIIVAESDERVTSGSAEIEFLNDDVFIYANTDFGNITVSI